MRKFAIIALSVALAVTAGCGKKTRIAGPTAMGDGTFIVGSYSKALSSEKVKMLEIANAFCDDRHQKMQIKQITVSDRRSGQKTAVAVAEAIMHQAGNIEVIFTCEKPE